MLLHLDSLLVLTTLYTGPNISFAINQLCQLILHNPSTTHWSAVKSVLRYLKGTINHGLYFGCRTLSLNAYCDLDWIGGLDV
jgi:hypothetical protein